MPCCLGESDSFNFHLAICQLRCLALLKIPLTLFMVLNGKWSDLELRFVFAYIMLDIFSIVTAFSPSKQRLMLVKLQAVLTLSFFPLMYLECFFHTVLLGFCRETILTSIVGTAYAHLPRDEKLPGKMTCVMMVYVMILIVCAFQCFVIRFMNKFYKVQEAKENNETSIEMQDVRVRR